MISANESDHKCQTVVVFIWISVCSHHNKMGMSPHRLCIVTKKYELRHTHDTPLYNLDLWRSISRLLLETSFLLDTLANWSLRCQFWRIHPLNSLCSFELLPQPVHLAHPLYVSRSHFGPPLRLAIEPKSLLSEKTIENEKQFHWKIFRHSSQKWNGHQNWIWVSKWVSVNCY